MNTKSQKKMNLIMNLIISINFSVEEENAIIHENNTTENKP